MLQISITFIWLTKYQDCKNDFKPNLLNHFVQFEQQMLGRAI